MCVPGTNVQNLLDAPMARFGRLIGG